MLGIEELPTKLNLYEALMLELVERDTRATGECILSRDRIARELGCTQQTVLRVVNRLEEKGALVGPRLGGRRGPRRGDQERYAFGPLFFPDGE